MPVAKAATLAEALVAAQAEFPAVEPNAVNPHFKSKFVTLDHLIAKTRPILNKHGLAITQEPSVSEGGFPTLTTTLLHISGESRSSVMPLLLTKQDMQGLGAALTYAKRYAWSAALGISADEDDDGNAASAKAEPKTDVPDALQAAQGEQERKELQEAVQAGIDRLGPLDAAWTLPSVLEGATNMTGRPITAIADLKTAELEKILRALRAAEEQAEVPA